MSMCLINAVYIVHIDTYNVLYQCFSIYTFGIDAEAVEFAAYGGRGFIPEPELMIGAQLPLSNLVRDYGNARFVDTILDF